MPSLLLQFKNGSIRTRKFSGRLRSLACDKTGQKIFIVGDRGRILILEGEKVLRVQAGTHQNLRAVSLSPSDGTAMIVGNTGTLLRLDTNDNVTKIDSPTAENLRSISWKPNGTSALIVGNRGTLLRYSHERIEALDDGTANLRRVAWQPKSQLALVASNCFAEEFIPSPNLFVYDEEKNALSSLSEGRSDLIGIAWNPDGLSALVVGYDIMWHNGFIGLFDGLSLSPIGFENRRIYPVAVAWQPTGVGAAIVTATSQVGMGQGCVYLWDRASLKPIFRNDEFFFSAVEWNAAEMVALASDATRTFNC